MSYVLLGHNFRGRHQAGLITGKKLECINSNTEAEKILQPP